MIRHSSSLFFSFIVHIILLVFAFYTYKFVSSQKKEELPEHRVCVELCHFQEPKPKAQVPKPTPKPKPKPKKIEKKVVKKEVPKKVIAKKEILIVKEEEVEVIIPKKVQILIPKEEPKVILIEEITEVESASQRNIRLEKEYIDDNVLKIRELISDNLYYPRSARKRGIVGDVVVKFTLLKNSEVDNTSIVSSASEILSRAAIKTIQDLSGEFPQPKTKLTLHVPISYTLQ